MIELRIGDKVRIKCILTGFDHQEYCSQGVITKIDDNAIQVQRNGPLDWWHRWQVRKLIKKIICCECHGKGRYMLGSDLHGNRFLPGTYNDCYKCKGTGKVRV